MSPERDVLPVIVGTDLNAYHMAASFHEAYGIRPHLIGKVQMGFTHYSTIIGATTFVDRLDDTEVFVPTLRDYAEQLDTDAELLLVGTNDHYVRLIVENSEALAEHYRFNYPNETLLNQLQVKDQFYPLAQQHGLQIPETHIHQVGQPLEAEISRYPVILKPGDGVQYYRHKFPGQEKVYRLYSYDDVAATIETIEASGYRGTVIIQDFIPGDDTFIWDSVLYLNSESRAEFVNFGQVVLQEHEASAIGNYTAIVSRFNREVMTQLKDFLEAVGYTGLANVDLKYDARDDAFKVLEVNVRQGRSSWYATAQGHNLAAALVEDVIYGRRSSECTFVDEEVLFTVVPTSILRRYVTEPAVHADVVRLIREKKVRNPLYYSGDRRAHPNSLLRLAWLTVRGMRYRKKYARATWRDQL
ncbi:ATP-grasp domain-containing protein [Nesterenkonia sp.]|uniref:carboxylate--amine ligase n=1 Tax=Nesterenkonia sp. TaxID=704201 RepID=UPI0026195E39|nr:ATP-grasp domain-containing protein [Nesterenkonia sp.]